MQGSARPPWILWFVAQWGCVGVGGDVGGSGCEEVVVVVRLGVRRV